MMHLSFFFLLFSSPFEVNSCSSAAPDFLCQKVKGWEGENIILRALQIL